VIRICYVLNLNLMVASDWLGDGRPSTLLQSKSVKKYIENVDIFIKLTYRLACSAVIYDNRVIYVNVCDM